MRQSIQDLEDYRGGVLAQYIAAADNPETRLLAISLRQAVYKLCGEPVMDALLLYGEHIETPDPTPEQIAEAWASEIAKNRAYLARLDDS